MNGIRSGTQPLAFDRNQAIARAQAAFQAFKPPGGPDAAAAMQRMVADTAHTTGLSPESVQRLWASYAQAAAQGIPPETMARVEASARSFLGGLGVLWAEGEAALTEGVQAIAEGAEALVGASGADRLNTEGLSEDVKGFQDSAKAIQGEAGKVLKGLRATSQGLGAEEGGRVLQALDATEAKVKATGDRVKAVGGLGLAGTEAVEGAAAGWEAAQALAQGDLSAAGDLVKGTEAVADFANQSSTTLQGLRAQRELPEGTRFAQGLDRFARGALTVQRLSQAVLSGEKLWGQGGALAKAVGGLGQGDLAQGVLDAGNAALDATKGVGDAAKAVRDGALGLGAAEGRVAKAASALSMEGDLAKARLGAAGGTLGALGGLLQLRAAYGSFSEGKLMQGTSQALGGTAATLEGVGQVAKVVAPAGRLATTLGGRAVPLLGVVSGVAQSAGALAKEPPDVKSAATGAASAVGSALLPFAPVGTAVGGALIVGAAIVDNWDAIASAGEALGEGAEALAERASEGFQRGLSSVAGWFS